MFEFELRPVDQIEPSTKYVNSVPSAPTFVVLGNSNRTHSFGIKSSSGREELWLSWFAFTDGFYRIATGSDTLFTYTPEFLKAFEDLDDDEIPEQSTWTWADYYVVRLWEDLLATLPAILHPVPHSMFSLLEADYPTCHAWKRKIFDLEEDFASLKISQQEAEDMVDKALSWWLPRQFPSSPLAWGPEIWMWSDEQRVYIAWDNRHWEKFLDDNYDYKGGIWSASRGQYSLPRETFIEEVRNFNDALISQMEERVRSITTSWSRPEIKIDFEELQREQAIRAGEFERVLAKLPYQPQYSWDEVHSAIMKTGIGYPK